jgi:hypothetical protein
LPEISSLEVSLELAEAAALNQVMASLVVQVAALAASADQEKPIKAEKK